MASISRQERRRKIVERGSDRLALITGQIQNLNESPSSTPTYANRQHTHTESSPSIMFSSHDHSKINAGPDVKDNSISKLMKLRTISAIPESRNYGSPKKSESRFRNESKSFDSPDPSESQDHEITPIPEKLKPQDSETKTGEIQKSEVVIPQPQPLPNNPPHHIRYKFFSSKRINASIIASERTRAICSLIVACLVVISYIDYPLFGINIVSSESFIASRPLYIILLTDVTIVFARLFREGENNGSEEVEVEKKEGIKDDGDNWDDAVKLLERGLVLYQAFRGIFIDCSVYLVVVICVLSLA
ncbi:uncharacterized protein LOC126682523 [Mercurialis annua]|uniref:uncharacterized protein LOC126682523 n=1 Tax=Mercurialis annua TaxID=3986 RepID=UPI00215FEA14|nr:uncharacterized protein LOC126682523 [Mercurialis annua]